MQVDMYSLSKFINNSCNEMVDVNAIIIREAKHTSNTHLPSSFNGKLKAL